MSFVEVNFPQTADLLKSGSIHAGVSADPFLKRALGTGAKPLAYFAATLPPQTTGVFYGTTRQWATANPAAVRGFRAAIAEAVAFTEKNPQAARAHGQVHQAAAGSAGLDPDAAPVRRRDGAAAALLGRHHAWLGLVKTKANAAQLIAR
ncbi:ABC transporter substrate-binding protein [Ramlibacter terrae]|uniref:ABC transporter substrate-binding protein n=1 Tax=Ramlibacter terrae TaxID=2732511 RepID=A0ABX6P2W5_9BURK|nr:ABC transporter substrate-binding protein [Ramlibacter terrae]